MRYLLAGVVLLVCMTGIAAFFWQQEMKYILPTPVPVDYKEVNPGELVNMQGLLNEDQAYFIHFYNPDCPCSRFNSKHVRTLIHDHNDSIPVVIVVPSHNDITKAVSEFGKELHVIADDDGIIAKACGVYSTPQAVIIDRNNRLYYRGNYNKARYCTISASNFAELSLIAFLNNQPAPSFGLAATQSYGCSLDEDKDDVEFF